jgi:transposase
MDDQRSRKLDSLRKTGLLHPAPERVNDPWFQDHPEFFDAHDFLQVRYEMIRSHRIDGDSVVEICRRYGVSRQTFYTLQERFVSEGTAGLLSRKPGPQGPSKLTPEVLGFIEQQLELESELRTVHLQSQLDEKMGVSFHRRTLEKLLKELRSKKNF